MNNDVLFNWMERELYPALFDNMANVLPEFEFKRVGNKWISTNTLKINGETGSDKGKVYVYANTPGLLKDWRVEAKPIVKYLMERRNKTYFEVVETLSREANLKPPTNPDFNPKAYEEHQRKLNILELCNKHFIDNLSNPEKAIEVVTYLQSRGFTVEEAKAMEIGLISSQSDLILYLKKNGYSEELINETLDLKADTRIGNTHKLTIPFRSGGALKGFKFRTIGDTHPKYINSKDLDINGGFFNLLSINGDKDITIVEGEIDALHATLKGVENVVATGGRSINTLQVRDAIRKGAKKFTLCLDNDPGKEEETRKAINRAIDTILKEGVKNILIASLEAHNGEKIDPDTLIKEKGIEVFKEALNDAKPYYHYKLNAITNSFNDIMIKENRALNFRETTDLKNEVVQTATEIKDLIDRDIYQNLFLTTEASKQLGITEEALKETVKELSKERDQRETVQALKALNSKQREAIDKGDTNEAFKLFKEAQRIEVESKATDLSELYHTITEEELTKSLKENPESLNSGYTIGVDKYETINFDEKKPLPLFLPSGALSVIAGPTAHGKTTFLINLALNVVENHPEKETYFFSYEEHSNAILMNALNSYIGKNTTTLMSGNCRGAIKHYFATGELKYFKENAKEEFIELKDKFFKEIVSTNKLNVKYVNYDCETLITAIHALKENTNVGAIFIDYIQLINLAPGHRKGSRQEEVKEITDQLKEVSVETGLPIIVGAQFNRTAKNLLQLHPTNLGEAGDIERSANLIIAFWNNEYKPAHGSIKESEIKTIEKFSDPGTLYVEIIKNRAGVVGLSENLAWNGNTATIKNLSPEEQSQRDYDRGGEIEEAGNFGATNSYKKNDIEYKPKVELPFKP